MYAHIALQFRSVQTSRDFKCGSAVLTLMDLELVVSSSKFEKVLPLGCNYM
jgi:hypothetical protein